MAEQKDLKAGLILVADDDASFQKAFCEMLNLRGYEPVMASSRDEVRDFVRRRQFDLLILDLMWDYADYNGIDILCEVLQLDANLPVVMLTSKPSIRTAVEAIQLGAFDYLEKGSDREKTMVLVKNAAETGRLRRENAAFLKALCSKWEIVGASLATRSMLEHIRKIGPSDSVVLITGESGTGKFLVANQIHYHSARRQKEFVQVDLTSINASLAESELFGHCKGALTGAQDRPGLVARAEDGTLFLDEISSASPALQANLLHLLQQREYRRVGEDHWRPCNVRIIAATNQPLPELVGDGRFRRDLYYRLKVVEIVIPPLRERKEDIGFLAQHFMKVKSLNSGSHERNMTPEAQMLLLDYDWPGNVRQLENMIESIVVCSPEGDVTAETVRTVLGNLSSGTEIPFQSLQEMTRQFKRECVVKALTLTEWNVVRAARLLGIDRSHLHRLINEFQLVAGQD